MIWPSLVSFIGLLQIPGVGSPKPRALDDGTCGRMGGGFFTESLQHDHRHLGQKLTEILKGWYSTGRHLAAPRDPGELAAEVLLEIRAKIVSGRAHPQVLAVPGNQD